MNVTCVCMCVVASPQRLALLQNAEVILFCVVSKGCDGSTE